MPFEIIRNDITKMRVDAIVNAANPSLLGGGGVDGAIHRAAGAGLLAECRGLGGCETGQAKITGGYRLPCRFVIHTVGPVWRGGGHGEKELLLSCYARSLALAEQHGCETVAFPLISAGAYGYPRDRAMQTALEAIRAFLAHSDMTVYLVIFDSQSFLIGRALYDPIRAYIDDAYIPADYEETEKSRRYWNLPLPSLAKKPTAAPPPSPERPQASFAAEAREDSAAPCMADTGAFPADRIESALRNYLSEMDEGFRDMLLRKIDEKGVTDAECYKRANVDRKLFNKIKNQPDYRPGKATVLAFAVALELSLKETRELLEKAGFSLSHSSKFDLIVEFFISSGRYDIYEINEALFSFDQKLLGSAAP